MGREVMADQGADANLISEQLMNKIPKEAPTVVAVPFNTEQIYRGITGDPFLNCDKKGILDVFLRVTNA